MTITEDRSRIVIRRPVASWKAAAARRPRCARSKTAISPPPAVLLLGIEVEQVSELVTFAFDPAEYHYNPLGTVHGGSSRRCR
jgi:acyl-coenzyme A thioesterase PaaI-like protein